MLKRDWPSILCLISFILCLVCGQVFAQNTESPLQAGLERYQTGDFQAAIALWTKALDSPKQTDRILLLKSLARVYSQVGQYDSAIATINPLISHCQTNGDRTQLGHILTEQAQAYSNLGQQCCAIAW
jgi:tetratricopeptide (TPR) repeat protein